MNFRNALITAACIFFVGCASTPLDPRTVKIDQREIRDYWVPAAKQSTVHVPETSSTPTAILVRYAIGSNGRVSHVEVLNYTGASNNVRYLTTVLKGTLFEPTSSNPDRTPILVEQEMSYSEVYYDDVDDIIEDIEKESAGRKIESIEIAPSEPVDED